MVYLLKTRLCIEIEEMEDALDVCPEDDEDDDVDLCLDLLAASEMRWSGEGGADMRCEVNGSSFVKLGVGLARGDKLSLRLKMLFGDRAGMEKLMKFSAGFIVCFSVVIVGGEGVGGGYKPRHCLISLITLSYSPPSLRRSFAPSPLFVTTTLLGAQFMLPPRLETSSGKQLTTAVAHVPSTRAKSTSSCRSVLEPSSSSLTITLFDLPTGNISRN